MRSRMFAVFLLAVVGVVGVAGFALGASSAEAEPAEAQAPQAAQVAVGTGFTYQGRLTGDSGPISDTCDFTFELWDAASGGNLVGTVNESGVTVSDGLFTVQLDFGDGAFTGDAGWLEITADCGDGAQTLTPRQPLNPAPYALGLRPGTAVSGTVSSGGVLTLTNNQGDGLRIDDAADDGVQVTNADYGFYAADAGVDGVYVGSAGNDGLYVESADSDGVQVQSVNYGFYSASSDTDGIFVNNADADGDGVGIAGYFDGDVRVTERLTATNLYAVNKNFVIDHPQDPENAYLLHSSVESPERMNVYNGNVTLDENGEAWVQLPDYFEALNRDFRYQLTPIGGPGPNLYVAQEIENNRFRVAGGEPGLKVSWQVTGVRDDAWARENPMRVEVEKSEERKGRYLNPEVYGQPAEQGIGAAERGDHAADSVKQETNQ